MPTPGPMLTPPTTLAVGVRSFVLEQHFTFEYDVGVWSMGSVQALKDRRSGVLKTCRSIFKPRLTSVWTASQELAKLKMLQHPMLSAVTDVLEDSEYLFVVSLRANGGDLAEFLDRRIPLLWRVGLTLDFCMALLSLSYMRCPNYPFLFRRSDHDFHKAHSKEDDVDGCGIVPAVVVRGMCGGDGGHASGGDEQKEEMEAATKKRFAVASETFGEGQELSLAVHAAVPSPASPEKACLLHCPSHWGSDHRYEVYSLDTSNPDSFPALEPLFVSSASKAEKEKLVEAGIAQIAPKQRHGFSLAPYDCSLYFLCGLQHFPGDVTGSFVYCFSLEEREWTEVEYTGTFPATKPGVSYQGCRFGQSCVVQGQRAWIFGGCVSNEAGGVQPTSGLFSFDLEEHHFEEIAAASPSNWPPALTAHSSVAFDGKVFVFGGGDGAQDVYCYDVAKSSWALLPPLLLGPRPCDGRVAHAVADGYVVAYQQTEGSDPASEEPNVGHSLFRITRDQLSRRAETSARDFRDHKPEGMSELDFLLDEATADAAFLIDDTKLPVHRAVLRRFAPALAKVVAEKPVVALNGKGVTIPAVQQLLQHVYSRYMDPVSPAEAEMLLKLAHHFQLMPLVQLCQENIVIDASNVRELLDYASRVTPPLETLNQKCYEFWTSHPEHLSFMKSPVRDRLPSNLPTVASPELRAATESEALELLFCGELCAFASDLFPHI
ncbi:unnamed protein product [Symbiodinium sp. CCMP2592]|nr:unnamed protein product [Symbiodinium sp. CCMP2592]